MHYNDYHDDQPGFPRPHPQLVVSIKQNDHLSMAVTSHLQCLIILTISYIFKLLLKLMLYIKVMDDILQNVIVAWNRTSFYSHGNFAHNKVASNSHDTLDNFVAGNSCAQQSSLM